MQSSCPYDRKVFKKFSAPIWKIFNNLKAFVDVLAEKVWQTNPLTTSNQELLVHLEISSFKLSLETGEIDTNFFLNLTFGSLAIHQGTRVSFRFRSKSKTWRRAVVSTQDVASWHTDSLLRRTVNIDHPLDHILLLLYHRIFFFSFESFFGPLKRLIVSMLHQNQGGIGKSIPDAQEISRDPRDFPMAKP